MHSISTNARTHIHTRATHSHVLYARGRYHDTHREPSLAQDSSESDPTVQQGRLQQRRDTDTDTDTTPTTDTDAGTDTATGADSYASTFVERAYDKADPSMNSEYEPAPDSPVLM